MPGWGWVILVIAALTVFILGVVYALLHLKDALGKVSGIAGQVQSRISRMMENKGLEQRDMVPSFTKTIRENADAYSQAHAGIIERRRRRSRRHQDQWTAWADSTREDTDRLAQQLNISEND